MVVAVVVVAVAATTTVNVEVAKLVPSVAVTIYVVCVDTTVGVPETAPVVALRVKPVGNAGDTVKVFVPVTVGAAKTLVVAIAVPTTPETA